MSIIQITKTFQSKAIRKYKTKKCTDKLIFETILPVQRNNNGDHIIKEI